MRTENKAVKSFSIHYKRVRTIIYAQRECGERVSKAAVLRYVWVEENQAEDIVESL